MLQVNWPEVEKLLFTFAAAFLLFAIFYVMLHWSEITRSKKQYPKPSKDIIRLDDHEQQIS